jgi:hypothetical protein
MRLIPFLILIFLAPMVEAQKGFFQARPFGGERNWERWIEQEIYLPEQILDQDLSVKVIFEFEVLTNGQIKWAKILNEVDEQVKKEAWRLFDLTLWEPGIYDGEKINSTRTISIEFSTFKYRKWVRERGYYTPPNYRPDAPLTIFTQEEVDTVPQPQISTSFFHHLQKEIIYPREAVKHGIQGEAAVGFIIEPSGVISNLFIAKNLGGGCAQELERQIKKIKWESGYKDGVPVRTFMIVQMQFSMSGIGQIRYLPAQNYGGYF